MSHFHIKNKIRSFIANSKKFLHHKHLSIFGKLLHDPNLLHLNRYSVSTAFSVGIFAALMPIPFQMIVAAAFAILVRSNLPIAIALVWITNPFTTPPISFFCYKLGALLLNEPLHPFHFEFSLRWLVEQFNNIGKPFLVGSIVVATFFALLSNFIIRMLWRYHVIKAWKARKHRVSKPKKKRHKK